MQPTLPNECHCEPAKRGPRKATLFGEKEEQRSTQVFPAGGNAVAEPCSDAGIGSFYKKLPINQVDRQFGLVVFYSFAKRMKVWEEYPTISRPA